MVVIVKFDPNYNNGVLWYVKESETGCIRENIPLSDIRFVENGGTITRKEVVKRFNRDSLSEKELESMLLEVAKERKGDYVEQSPFDPETYFVYRKLCKIRRESHKSRIAVAELREDSLVTAYKKIELSQVELFCSVLPKNRRGKLRNPKEVREIAKELEGMYMVYNGTHWNIYRKK